MNRFVRTIVLWLLMLAAPIQGLAFAAMSRCHHHAPDHAGTSGHRLNDGYHTPRSHDHERQKHDSGLSQHEPSSHDRHVLSSAETNCCASYCGASCPFIVAPAFSLMHAALPADHYFLIEEPLYSGFVPNVATRPPVDIPV